VLDFFREGYLLIECASLNSSVVVYSGFNVERRSGCRHEAEREGEGRGEGETEKEKR
jgi:hypothetical protein